MAWNGSDSAGGKTASAKSTRSQAIKQSSNTTMRHGIVAGLIVVVLGGSAIWWFVGRSKTTTTVADETRNSRPTKIVEVTPHIVTNQPEEVVEEQPKKIDPNARPTKIGEKLNGYVMLANGTLHKIRGEVHTKPTRGKYAIFDYPAENIIAGLISIEPGQSVVGTRDYQGRFTKNFLKSLNTPIIVKETDDDETKALKRAVNEAKIELKLAYDRGEDIEAIVTQAREDAQKMATVRQELRKEVLKGMREVESVQDGEDLLAAANKILEDKGIAPLDDTPLNKVRMKYQKDAEEKNTESTNEENQKKE